MVEEKKKNINWYPKLVSTHSPFLHGEEAQALSLKRQLGPFHPVTQVQV